jgi:hypothetical protein
MAESQLHVLRQAFREELDHLSMRYASRFGALYTPSIGLPAGFPERPLLLPPINLIAPPTQNNEADEADVLMLCTPSPSRNL